MLIDQERRWLKTRSGDSTPRGVSDQTLVRQVYRVEDYLRLFPGIDPDETTLRELVLREFRLRRETGQRPTVEEYQLRFPEHTDAVRKVNDEGSSRRVRPSGSSRKRHDSTILKTGDLFGDYVIVEQVGRGGMGVVFRAVHKVLDREVALKMILAGQLAGEEDIARFRSEAQAAAKMDHPHIVPVYDVGEINGQHFFSMAFIAGETLQRQLHQGPLPPDKAANITLKLAKALAYAHAKGVIHRDIKPANVIVDANGEPRITDFGLAKRTSSDDLLTATNAILGTPSYMSPEQASGHVADVTEYADVYSLGATLYCLLTGKPPFQADTAWETIRQLQERSPISPRDLNRAIPKDLDTICLKCIEKDPANRYTAEALADDLGRFIHSEPITARPTSRLTRTARWCRRNWLVASLITTACLSLIAGVVMSTQFAVLAERRARVADQTALFLKKLFRDSESLNYTGSAMVFGDKTNAEMTALELLERGANRVHTELNADPYVTAQLMQTIGEVYVTLGYPKKAAEQLRGSYQYFREHHGESHEKTCNAMHHLAWALTLDGNCEESSVLGEELLELRRKTLGERHPDTTTTMMLLGLTYSMWGKYDRAMEIYEEVIQLHHDSGGKNREATGMAYAGKASVELALGQELRASGSLDEAMHYFEGIDSGNFLEALINYQRAEELAKRQADEAAEMFDESLASIESILGPEHLMVAWVAGCYADCLNKIGRSAEAERQAERSLAIMKKRLLQPTHPKFAHLYRSLAVAQWDLGKYQEAEESCRIRLEIRDTQEPRDETSIAHAKHDLAFVLMAQRNYSHAMSFAAPSWRRFSLPFDKARDTEFTASEYHSERIFIARTMILCLIQFDELERAVEIGESGWNSIREHGATSEYETEFLLAYAAALMHADQPEETIKLLDVIETQEEHQGLRRLLVALAEAARGAPDAAREVLVPHEKKILEEIGNIKVGVLVAPKTIDLVRRLPDAFAGKQQEQMRRICNEMVSLLE